MRSLISACVRLIVLDLLVVWSAQAVCAQVMPGANVLTHAATRTQGGGVILYEPRLPGGLVSVTNLPADLVGRRDAVFASGASSAEVLADGRLVVGPLVEQAGAPVDLHVLTLNGADVVADVRVPVGTTGPFPVSAGVVDMASLPDGRILLAVGLLIGLGPLGGERFAVFDPATGSLSPLAVRGVPVSNISGLTATSDGETAFVVFDIAGGTAFQEIWSFSVSGGLGSLVGTIAFCQSIAVNSQGEVFASVLDGVVRLDPQTGVETLLVRSGDLPSVALESATDTVAYAGSSGRGFIAPDGRVTPLGGIGSIRVTDLTVFQNPLRFGRGTPGSETYGWATAPNAGGLPRVGNASFSIRATSTAPTIQAGFLLAAAGGGRSTVLGIDLLLDPASRFLVGPLASDGLVPLPEITMVPVGTTIAFQAVHLDPGGPAGVLAASDALCVTVMR